MWFFTSNIGWIIENKHNDAGVDLNKKQLWMSFNFLHSTLRRWPAFLLEPPSATRTRPWSAAEVGLGTRRLKGEVESLDIATPWPRCRLRSHVASVLRGVGLDGVVVSFWIERTPITMTSGGHWISPSWTATNRGEFQKLRTAAATTMQRPPMTLQWTKSRWIISISGSSIWDTRLGTIP